MLGNFKHGYHVPTQSFLGFQFAEYLQLSDTERESEYGKKILDILAVGYAVFTGGKCCDNFKHLHKDYKMIHDRRGHGGYFPGTLDPPVKDFDPTEKTYATKGSLGCCPTQCERKSWKDTSRGFIKLDGGKNELEIIKKTTFEAEKTYQCPKITQWLDPGYKDWKDITTAESLELFQEKGKRTLEDAIKNNKKTLNGVEHVIWANPSTTEKTKNLHDKIKANAPSKEEHANRCLCRRKVDIQSFGNDCPESDCQ